MLRHIRHILAVLDRDVMKTVQNYYLRFFWTSFSYQKQPIILFIYRDLSRKPLVFSLPNRLPTITTFCLLFYFYQSLQTHHLMFPWKQFGYIVACSFTYTYHLHNGISTFSSNHNIYVQIFMNLWYSTLQTGPNSMNHKLFTDQLQSNLAR